LFAYPTKISFLGASYELDRVRQIKITAVGRISYAKLTNAEKTKIFGRGVIRRMWGKNSFGGLRRAQPHM